MRVVAIVVLTLVLTTPSKSSQSCMTKTEARQHFGWLHIYWQGKYRLLGRDTDTSIPYDR
jgi:hypothetical protein